MTNIPKPKQIPDTATKVFSGVIHDVYHYPQEFFDGSIQTMEKIVRPDSVLVIPVLLNRNILMSRQIHPGGNEFISFFGGRVEANEDILEAAKRELAEESGLVSLQWEEVYCESIAGNMISNRYCFIANDCEYKLELELDAGEKITTFEIKPESILDAMMDQKCREKDFRNYLLELYYKGLFEGFVNKLR